MVLPISAIKCKQWFYQYQQLNVNSDVSWFYQYQQLNVNSDSYQYQQLNVNSDSTNIND